MPTSHPAEETGQTIATVSHHLRKLKLAGIVGARRQGRPLLYILSNVRVFFEIARLAAGERLQPRLAVSRSTDAGWPEQRAE